MTVRAVSYGGGVQSTALIVLVVQGRVRADVALFANVGDDSEHPATLRYVRDVAQPWASDHGLDVVEVRRDGPTLLEIVLNPDDRSTPIPLRARPVGAPGPRSCTKHWKVAVVARWLGEHGATADDPADVLIGISIDEIERATTKPGPSNTRRVYPLLDLGLDRAACASVIRAAGLPVPPKSACWFCPFHRLGDWSRMRRDEPDLFARAVGLEHDVNAQRVERGQNPAYLSRNGPLEDIVEAPAQLFAWPASDIGATGCDEGVCFV